MGMLGKILSIQVCSWLLIFQIDIDALDLVVDHFISPLVRLCSFSFPI